VSKVSSFRGRAAEPGIQIAGLRSIDHPRAAAFFSNVDALDSGFRCAAPE
jgi:hypothetical protein